MRNKFKCLKVFISLAFMSVLPSFSNAKTPESTLIRAIEVLSRIKNEIVTEKAKANRMWVEDSTVSEQLLIRQLRMGTEVHPNNDPKILQALSALKEGGIRVDGSNNDYF